jgi:hypothetical protein
LEVLFRREHARLVKAHYVVTEKQAEKESGERNRRRPFGQQPEVGRHQAKRFGGESLFTDCGWDDELCCFRRRVHLPVGEDRSRALVIRITGVVIEEMMQFRRRRQGSHKEVDDQSQQGNQAPSRRLAHQPHWLQVPHDAQTVEQTVRPGK